MTEIKTAETLTMCKKLHRLEKSFMELSNDMRALTRKMDTLEKINQKLNYLIDNSDYIIITNENETDEIFD